MSDILMHQIDTNVVEEKNIIKSLYDKVMQDFNGIDIAVNSNLMENGYYQELYAPGYDVIGIGDIVAQCK